MESKNPLERKESSRSSENQPVDRKERTLTRIPLPPPSNNTSTESEREDTTRVSADKTNTTIPAVDISQPQVELPPPISLDSLPGYRQLVTEPATFSPTSIGAPSSQEEHYQNSSTLASPSVHPNILPSFVATSGDGSEGVVPRDSDNFETPPTESNNEMGIFSAFTGNVNAPEKDKRRSVSRSNTAKTTGTTQSSVAPGTTAPTGASTGVTIGETAVPAAVVPVVAAQPSHNEESRSINEDRAVTPAPRSVEDRPITPAPGSYTERAVTPTPRTPATVTKGLDRDNETVDSASNYSQSIAPAGAMVADGRDPVDAPNGIEHGVPVDSSRDGEYEGTTHTRENSEYPERPAFNDQPSRSYIKGREGSTRNSIHPDISTVNEEVLDRAPAVLERDENGQPKNIDLSTASPANIGDREHVGGVIALPAGGGLHRNDSDRRTERPAESVAGDLHERPETRQSFVATEAPREHESKRDSVIPASVAPATIVPATVAATSVAPASVNGSAYPYEKSAPDSGVRQLMHEGQAYREDGLVQGQPPYQQQQQQAAVPHSYAPVAGGAAGGIVGATLANGYQHEQQQHQPQFQQQQGQYAQQQQRFPDQSFANERAMSPGPEQGLSRLSIQDPKQQGSAVGPSPGPPVAAFKPNSSSPSRVMGGSAANGGLDRANTYRTGVSRGSTIRRGGAFANGSALSGGGVSEAYSREDIHSRNDLATRNLIAAGAPGAAVSRKISTHEKKDAKRMSKLIIKEGHIEAAAVKGAMKELESMQKIQKAAAYVSTESSAWRN